MGHRRVRERTSHAAFVVFALVAIVQAVTARSAPPRAAPKDDAQRLEGAIALLVASSLYSGEEREIR